MPVKFLDYLKQQADIYVIKPLEYAKEDLNKFFTRTKQQTEIYITKPIEYAIEDLSSLPKTIPKTVNKIEKRFDKILGYAILAGVLLLVWKISRK